MRSGKLTTAATAATAALMALAPAGALAARNHHHSSVRNGSAGGCAVTLHFEKQGPLTSGDQTLALGRGHCGQTPSAGQTVTLYERPAEKSAYSAVGTTTTDPAGYYQVSTGPIAENTSFYAAIGSAQSAPKEAKVAAVVSLNGPPENKPLLAVRSGFRNGITFNGKVPASDKGAWVVLQRENALKGEQWYQISHRVRVDEEGNFSIEHWFRVAGASYIRVVVRGTKHFTASPSTELSYTITQAQNPQLTVESTQDPVPFGSATSIGGKAPGLASTALTLLGRTGGTAGFRPIATTMTDGEGNYSFASIKPAASGFYRVEGGGRTSTPLYQGVKYVLTDTPPTTIQSGQLLTVTGTVTPVKAGHRVLLQKQNAGGSGFHTVGSGTVAADGTYTVSQKLLVPGSYTLRVKVPGDPENGATTSAPFATTVTAVPTSTLPAASQP